MHKSANVSRPLIKASRLLSESLEALAFSPPVAYAYNPLRYARGPYEEYLSRYASAPKKVLFLGMNPGPWGMAQTGVPFGEVTVVRDWLQINLPVGRPSNEHPRVPVLGFGCPRSEVSGRRLWGILRARYGTARSFFRSNFVANYCPLLFLSEGGGNLTPDKIATKDRGTLYAACDAFLKLLIDVLEPRWLIGIGKFAEKRLRDVVGNSRPAVIASIPHPSPASPAANRDWAGTATRTLEALGIW